MGRYLEFCLCLFHLLTDIWKLFFVCWGIFGFWQTVGKCFCWFLCSFQLWADFRNFVFLFPQNFRDKSWRIHIAQETLDKRQKYLFLAPLFNELATSESEFRFFDNSSLFWLIFVKFSSKICPGNSEEKEKQNS